MKYNKELYELSLLCNLDNDKKRSKVLKEVLDILIDKFKYASNNGLIVVRIASNDKYYNLFNSFSLDFLNEYFIYVSKNINGINSYLEFTWDYQAYYEVMEYYKVIDALKNVPVQLKNSAIKDILDILHSRKYRQSRSFEICQKNGHNYGGWKSFQDSCGNTLYYTECMACKHVKTSRLEPKEEIVRKRRKIFNFLI